MNGSFSIRTPQKKFERDLAANIEKAAVNWPKPKTESLAGRTQIAGGTDDLPTMAIYS